MGRKPNPIILEYFSRGAKLEDSSNRYQHTCKLCGEEFPKGRIDSLVAHLTKKCNSISLPERTKVVLRLHDLGENDDESIYSGNTTLERGKNIELPYSPTRSQNFNGLNVLAEASRRVGANDPGRGRKHTAINHGSQFDPPVDPALEPDDFHSAFLNPSGQSFDQREDVQAAVPALNPLFSYLPVQQIGVQDGQTNFPDLNYASPAAPGQVPSQLSSIAASANETLANNLISEDAATNLSNDLISNALFNCLNNLSQTHEGQDTTTSKQVNSDIGLIQQDVPVTVDETFQEALLPAGNRSGPPRPIAINPLSQPTHFVSESGTAARSPKPKVRARFTADRRKEVQQVRKQGACMRCRMLKKPCSNDTPCATCQGVESARLWKQGCIRTRIAEEFTLFSAGLHSTLSFHDINNAKSQLGFHATPKILEVSIFDKGSPSIPFPALQSTTNAAERLDGADDVFILNAEGDNITSKTRDYVQHATEEVTARESFHVVQQTVRYAMKQQQGKEDGLLAQVCELWTATTILADKDLVWRITAPSDNQGDSRHLSEAQDPHSHSLINSQLRSAMEKHGSMLSKSVMNEIERRLLQRQQCGRFETFLTALIFLNAAERMCWLYLTWDDEKGHEIHSRWPLDKRPGPYADQGERVADILNMLLRMRSLAPKCRPTSDSGILEAMDDEEGLAAEWFREIQITPKFLEEKATAQFDLKDFRSLDGTLFARILQPQTCYTQLAS